MWHASRQFDHASLRDAYRRASPPSPSAVKVKKVELYLHSPYTFLAGRLGTERPAETCARF
jgi:hypothetical protein